MEPSKPQAFAAWVRRTAAGTGPEALGLIAMAAIVMVLSYSGLRTFADTQHLPAPNLFPLAFDLPAVIVASAAWKAHRLASKAWPARLLSLVLVTASACLQASPTMAKVKHWADLWTDGLWAPLAAELGPPAIAYALLELFLWLTRLQQAAAVRTAEEERAERAAARAARRSTTATDPEVGQRRPAPSAPVLPGEKEPEVATAPPPAPQSADAEEVEAIAAKLAPDVDQALGDTDPTKDSVRPHVIRLRGTASTKLVLAVNRQVKLLRSLRSEAAEAQLEPPAG